jgi:hypothetical protein
MSTEFILVHFTVFPANILADIGLKAKFLMATSTICPPTLLFALAATAVKNTKKILPTK